MIKAIIFDMDGVLLDSEPFWQESEELVFKSLSIETSKELFVSFMGKRIDEVVDLMWQRQSWNKCSKVEVVNMIVENVIRLVNEKGCVLPGVIRSLDICRQNSLKIALASSSKLKIIETAIDKLQIRDYFDIIHSAEFEEYGKPNPQIFISTARMLNVSPEDCIVIEDSLNGVIAALAANMKCIAVPEKHAINKDKFIVANQILDSLEEFNIDSCVSIYMGQEG
jgi:sugar-phosphatase